MAVVKEHEEGGMAVVKEHEEGGYGCGQGT